MLTRLDIINSMLASKGTAPIATGYESHPNFIEANEVLTRVSSEVQSVPRWYNTSVRTLSPDVSGRVVLPATFIHVDPVDAALTYARRGTYLFDVANNTDVLGVALDATVVEELDITDLPPAVAAYIRAASVYLYFLDKKGEEPKLSSYLNIMLLTEAKVKAEDLRNRDLNYFNGGSASQLRRSGSGSLRLPT